MPLGPQLRSRIPKNASPWRHCPLTYASSHRVALSFLAVQSGSYCSRVSTVGSLTPTNGPNASWTWPVPLANSRPQLGEQPAHGGFDSAAQMGCVGCLEGEDHVRLLERPGQRRRVRDDARRDEV